MVDKVLHASFYTHTHTHTLAPMVSVDTANAVMGGIAIFYGVMWFVYAWALARYDERLLPRFASTLVYNLVVVSLLPLLYVWIIAGESHYLRWGVYALTNPFLIAIGYELVTCHLYSKDKYEGGAWQTRVYWAAMLCAFLLPLFYLMADLPGVTQTNRWIVLGVSLLPLIFLGVFLARVISYAPAEVDKYLVYFLYLVGFLWLAYPTWVVLSPNFYNVLSWPDINMAYAISDAVIKVIYGFCISYAIRKQCGQCTPKKCVHPPTPVLMHDPNCDPNGAPMYHPDQQQPHHGYGTHSPTATNDDRVYQTQHSYAQSAPHGYSVHSQELETFGGIPHMSNTYGRH